MQDKSFEKNKIFCGTVFASLPFWQKARTTCHFGRLSAIMSADRIGWYNPS